MKKTTTILFLTMFLIVSISMAQAPNLIWAKSMGGTNSEQAWSVVLDSHSNVYISGLFQGTVDFNPSPSAVDTFYLTSYGSDDIFVAKYDSSGNFIWVKRMGGTQSEGAHVALDAQGNIYLSGGFNGTVDFDPDNAGTYYLSSVGGSSDAYITKLDTAGNFIWAKDIGGVSSDWANYLAVDDNGSVYVTGLYWSSVIFSPTITLTAVGSGDIFVAKYDSSGSFVWAKSMGGSDDDFGMSLAVDINHNVYITGGFNSTVADFDPSSSGTHYLSTAGYHDIHIVKLDSNGNLVWANRVGGYGDDWCNHIVLDATGSIYITGDFYDVADFDPSSTTTYNLNGAGIWDIFIAKINNNGTLNWVKSMGGTGYEAGYGLEVDATGSVYISGDFNGTANFDSFTLTAAGAEDIYLTKLNSNGTVLWAKNMGGTNQDWGASVAIDAIAIYSTGRFQGTANFNIGGTPYNLISNGDNDIFLQKLSNTITGINELSKEVPFQLYPNPSSGTINFVSYQYLSQAKITIYNVYSQLIFEDENITGTSYQGRLNQQSNGVYFVTISAEGETYSTKIIIQR